MDLQMPEMNGFEATEYIRNKMNSTIPIIAVTADVTTSDMTRCKAVGMDDYISKPVDERILYSKITGLLKKPGNAKTDSQTKIEQIEVRKLKLTNLEYLKRRTKANPKLMMEMISIYLEQTASLIIAIKDSLQSDDWPQVQTIAHKMIPSFAIMGIGADHENLAKKIQEYARSKQHMEIMPDLIHQLTEILEQACTELKEEAKALENQTNK
jgi:CheY-like chemotaxis protein